MVEMAAALVWTMVAAAAAAGGGGGGGDTLRGRGSFPAFLMPSGPLLAQRLSPRISVSIWKEDPTQITLSRPRRAVGHFPAIFQSLRLKTESSSQGQVLKDSLVVFKNEPAIIDDVNEDVEKVTLSFAGSKARKAKLKDVAMIYEGPVRSWEVEELRKASPAPVNSIVDIHDLVLETGSKTIGELTQLLFEEVNHVTSWATWKIVCEDMYFHGEPSAIRAHSKESVDEKLEKIQMEKAASKEWEAFLKRIDSRKLKKGDVERLKDVEDLALMLTNTSKILKGLEVSQTAEVAHQLLIDLGVWTEDFNPWPLRFGVNFDTPKVTSSPKFESVERRDLTHLKAYAVDSEGIKDPDDALSIDSDGKIWVHIADVASIVTTGSEFDQFARARGSSCYLPEETINMLPETAILTMALGNDKTSPAFSVGFRVNGEGIVDDVEICKSLVSVTRVSYDDACEYIQDEDHDLGKLDSISQIYSDRRRRNGAITFQFPETEVKVSEGKISISPVEYYESKDMVMEFMLMAGEAVGKFAIEKEIPFLFSSQLPPADPNAQSKKPAPSKPKAVKSPTRLSEMFELRKRLVRTKLGEPGHHFSLGMPIYCQVTSPLRRYGDLVLHQQLHAYLAGQKLLTTDQLHQRVSETETQSLNMKKAERFSKQFYTLLWLKQEAAWRGEAICLSQRQAKPAAPKVAIGLIEDLAILCSVKLKKAVRKDEAFPIKLAQVRLIDMRADFIHDVDLKGILDTEELTVYKEGMKSRRNVGTRMNLSA